MKKTLFDLWYSYQAHIAQDTSRPDDERSVLLVEQSKIAKQLCSTMTEEQQEIFCSYEEASNSISSVSEREAFICGIRFAVSFLLEAINDN